jgi:hypothetical protein
MLIACGWNLGAAFAQEPPPPNPEQPVDYVAWLHKTFGGDIKDNAADRYQSAIDAYVDNEKAIEIIAGGFDWSDEQKKTIQDWVEKNEECLKRFARATRTDACYFGAKSDASRIDDIFFPDVKAMRSVGKAAVARAHLRVSSGEHMGALGDIDTLLRCARHFTAQPAVIHYLVGSGMRAWAEELLLDAPGLFESVHPQVILSRLGRVDERYPEPAFLTGERVFLLHVAQGCLRDDDGDGRFERLVVPPNEDAPDGIDTPQNPPLTANEQANDIRRESDHWREVWNNEYAAARDQAKHIEDEKKAGRYTAIASIFAPNLWRVRQLDGRGRAMRNGVRLVLALHAHHKAHGNWPRTLDEGVPKELAEFRIDPFSGKDLVYRIEKGEPLLYSVGENGVDDGGTRPENGKRWSSDGDGMLWPPAAKAGG